MTIEEKAKAYDEALERARRIKNGEGDWRYSDLIEIGPALAEIFPKLAESEDERMIDELNLLKEIQNYYKENLAGLYITFAMYKRIARYFYFLGKNEKR